MKEKFKLPEQAIRLWFWLFAAVSDRGDCHAGPRPDGRRDAAALHAAVSVGQQLF